MCRHVSDNFESFTRSTETHRYANRRYNTSTAGAKYDGQVYHLYDMEILLHDSVIETKLFISLRAEWLQFEERLLWDPQNSQTNTFRQSARPHPTGLQQGHKCVAQTVREYAGPYKE